MTRSALIALTICVCAAALEGALAGRGVKRRLAELRQPPHSPPFPVWVGIGLAYYAISFIVLSRLIAASASPGRWAAIAFTVSLLVLNAVWNLVFFRRRNVEATLHVSAVYGVLALATLVLLIRVDPVSAGVFLPYVLYLGYALWWVRALRRLNPDARPTGIPRA